MRILSWSKSALCALAGGSAGYALAEPTSAPASLTVGALASAAWLILQYRSACDQTRDRLHEELLLNETRYRSLVKATAAIVWRTGASGDFVTPQPEWSAFTGQSFRELAGKGWLDAVHPEDRERVSVAWSTALAKQGVYESEYRLRQRSGGYREVLARAAPVTDRHGRLLEWVGVNVDVSEQRRAQRVLADSERRMHRVLDSLYTYVAVLAHDGTVLTANTPCLNAAGISIEDVNGKPFWDTYWWSWSPHAQEKLKHAIHQARDGHSVRYEADIRVHDGEILTIDFMIAPMRDDDGAIHHLIASAVDVSDRRRTEQTLSEREQFYRQLIESMPLFTWTCLPDGSCDYICERWQKFAGPLVDPAGMFTTMHHVHPDDREMFRRVWEQAMKDGRSFQAELRLRRDDGLYRWFACYATPILSPRGQITKWCGTSIDIDDRKQMEVALRESEARLRALNSTLERRVRERTHELQERSDQLRALALDLSETESRERKRLAQVLHDHFQQLISAAKLKAGILRRRMDDEVNVQALRQIESLLEEAISASRSLATELSPPVLHDAGLIAALQWLVRRMEVDHQLQVELQLEGDCEPDNEQVRTIIFECVREILFNVRKHAEVEKARLTLKRLPEGILLTQVVDEGKGFEPIALERRKAGDTSFGLFSIRERLSLIGGLMKIESAPGKGTRVELSVPCISRTRPAESAARLGPHTEHTHRHGAFMRVLVADDHALFREGLVSLLSQEPYLQVVAQAADGEEAIRMAREFRPDLLIVDVSMPRANGVQVTSTIARELPSTRVIGLSMHEEEDMARAMRDAGAIAYFAKSDSPEDTLLAALRHLSRQMIPAASEAAAT